MSDNKDVIIIGAGVIGAATAFELAKQGYRTLSVDANAEAGHGSTSGSCAIIRVHYSTLDGTALAWEAYHDWRDWPGYLGVADERGLAEYRELGCLVMKTEQNGYMKKHVAICAQLGIPCEEWDEEQILSRLPNYRLDRFHPARRQQDEGFGEPTGGRVEGAVFFPTAGYVSDPALSAHNLQRAAESQGGEFLFNARVVQILRRDGCVAGVELADGRQIAAPVVINVAGPASRKVNELAGVTGDMNINTRALRQEVVHVPAPRGHFAEAGGLVVSDSDVALYCRPEGDDHLLIGSEDPPCDEHVWVDDPDDDAWREFSEQSRLQAMRMAQRVPGLGVPNRPRGVVDLYDVSDDWIPIYDKSCLPGFYMACGSSGNQYKNASVAGRMMAALVAYCEAGNDHDSAPLQLDLPRSGYRLDVGFFSRRRQINADSSFSVLG